MQKSSCSAPPEAENGVEVDAPKWIITQPAEDEERVQGQFEVMIEYGLDDLNFPSSRGAPELGFFEEPEETYRPLQKDILSFNCKNKI